jgi:hypothetical protein
MVIFIGAAVVTSSVSVAPAVRPSCRLLPVKYSKITWKILAYKMQV